MLTARLHFDANYHGQCDVPAGLGPVMAVLQVLSILRPASHNFHSSSLKDATKGNRARLPKWLSRRPMGGRVE